MAQPKDEFDADSIRNPELNPLMNPLLAANMGRWAEVYFTTVPEKREQAIYELILELRNNQPPERVSPKVIENKRTTDTIEQAEPKEAAAAQSGLTCAKCGERNPIDHRFCGICGAPLVAGEITSYEHGALGIDGMPAAKETANEFENSSRRDRGQRVTPPSLNSTPQGAIQPAIGSAQSYPSYSDFRLFAVEPEPIPNRRKYVSVILTVLMAALIYGVWRRSQTLSGSSAASPDRSQPVASVPPEASSLSPQPSPNAGSPSGSASPVVPPAVVPRATAPRSAGNRQVPHSKRHARVERPARPMMLASEKSPTNSAGVSGAQEFAVAERYLKGNYGRSGSSAEAAQWLWKAVGKGNLDATVTLSDLYLRGDGVPKSCDQGRVLLDAAARKGNATAADRIRHLQNFGCR